MDPARRKRIEQLFEAALVRPPRERKAFLERACGDDQGLRGEVEALLAQPSECQFDAPVADLADLNTDTSAPALVGRRIGPYQFDARIGAGGMGEVYRARDTRLGRDVAIKVLPSGFAADRNRLARFEREARLLAALNHPRIATIHGLEDLQGAPALIMELVEGSTQAERIALGPVAGDEALGLGQQIAEALEAAHDKGIIHRDLKPANIKITPSGDVKVLDFGLAKALAGEDSGVDMSHLPTLTATQVAGVIVGTPAYMSPEQSRGHAVDKRTDIWAFGCVVYEMLTGRMAFGGRTVSDTIAAILQRDPAWEALPQDAAPVVHTLRRCLQKDPRHRFRDIGDVRLDLQEAITMTPAGAVPVGATRRQVLSALAGVVIGSVSTGAVLIGRSRPSAPKQLTRFSMHVPEGNFTPSFNARIAITRDGRHLACNSGPIGRVFLRALHDLEFKPIEGVRAGVPFFSPDSRWLAFSTTDGSNQLKKVALSGGAPSTISQLDSFMGAAWADDDVIYLVPELPAGVSAVPAAGGAPKQVAAIDFANGERQHKSPCAVPGTDVLLFVTATADSATYDDATIVALRLGTGEKKVLLRGGTAPRYSPSGHLVYAQDGKLLAVRFDPERLQVSGDPVTVLDGVLMSRNTGVANFDISASGDLVYIRGICDGGARTLVWVDRSGRTEPVGLVARSYLHPRLSPDDLRLAIEIEGPSHDLFVYEFDRGVLSNITTDGVSHWPVWSPDGVQLGYRSGPMSKFTLWQVPADRSRPPAQVRGAGRSQSAESWSPDGRFIAYTVASLGTPASIMITHVDGSSEPETVAAGKAPQGSSKFSPDGRWLAYCSTESGRPEVYVQAFPGPGPKTQVSNGGGTDPVWRRSGGELYYRNGDSMMAVPVTTGPTLAPGRPIELWKGHYSHGMSSSCGTPGATSSNYDVTKDGSRFLMIQDDHLDKGTSTEVVVVQGWADEVSRLAQRT